MKGADERACEDSRLMSRLPTPGLTALVYETGQGAIADSLLDGAAVRLREHGRRLAGTIQLPSPEGSGHRCDLLGRDLGSEVVVRLSMHNGAHARGCRLDTTRLEHLAGLAMATLEAGADVLIVSRFGKREAQGGGFRSAIGWAATREVPVLVSVGRDHLLEWRSFAGDLATELPAMPCSIERWTAAVLGVPASSVVA